MALSLTDQLSYSTIRIETQYPNGDTGTGTGFFLNFLLKDDGTKVPVLVTNKHVIDGSIVGHLRFCTSDLAGNPIDASHHVVAISDFSKAWIYHPEPDVDLCVLPIAHILEACASNRLFYKAGDLSLIPSQEELARFSGVEEIFMIGYPNGLWDSANNKPIFRKGVTATHLKRDYCGKKEFLIDAACFPGSSGSPIYIINEGNYVDSGDLVIGESRLKLLGILYAGPQHTTQGEIKIINVPTAQVPMVLSTIPNNLGIVIKSERLRELETLVKTLFKL